MSWPEDLPISAQPWKEVTSEIGNIYPRSYIYTQKLVKQRIGNKEIRLTWTGKQFKLPKLVNWVEGAHCLSNWLRSSLSFLIRTLVDRRCWAPSHRVRICGFTEEWTKIEDLWKWKPRDPKRTFLKVKSLFR